MDKPVIQYVVEEAVASGIEHVIMVTSASKRAIEDHFDRQPELETRLRDMERLEELTALRQVSGLAAFSYVRQTEPKGNGHAVLCAAHVVGDEPFALIWGDDLVDAETPCLRQMLDVYEQRGGAVAAVIRVPREEVPKYGVVDAERIDARLHRIRGIVEKPSVQAAPSDLATIHAWILPPRIFDLLATTPPGKDGEIWLVDAIVRLLREEPVFALEVEGNHYDAGNRLDLLKASIDFSLRRADLAPGLRAYLERL